ncbi:hypothetical protein HU200_042450 [Digitaria exilis]|uniref:Uncharacterized protein n=1 Tax=Digitaria exilis TaxID=1010633 RepID=A0A835B513_9POAL|nr:hypothetical protein HU200_042450 [Digitaria exilis]
MHAIADISNGTFSFIDAEGSIQDGFAQCIGGLLSVVIKNTHLSIECVDDGVLLTSIKSGGYTSQVAENGRSGLVDIGDLYADEERGFLVTLHVPAAHEPSLLIKPTCTYKDAITTENIEVQGEEVSVQRPAHFVDCKCLLRLSVSGTVFKPQRTCLPHGLQLRWVLSLRPWQFWKAVGGYWNHRLHNLQTTNACH